MSILITQDPTDKRFTVIVSDMHDQPAQLLAAVNKHCPLHSIKSLFIAPNFNTAAWRHTLRVLTPHVVPGMHVQHYEVPSGNALVASVPSSNPASDGSLFGGLAANMFSLQMSDIQQAQTIFTQVDPHSQDQQAARWQTMQDTQTKIFQIQQDVTINKAGRHNRRFRSWHDYLRG